jgi:hypothetical protein
MIGDKNLTGVSDAQVQTYPGQAHFAIPGAKRFCGECWFWVPTKRGDKRAICGKAAQLQSGVRPRAVPSFAKICQYFRENAPTADDP